MPSDADYMRAALRLARRGYGATSPNPMVGAILIKGGQIIGRGWHHRAGDLHAEIEAIRDAKEHGQNTEKATLCVTLEPCCTYGRTPPCTDAIIAARISTVIIGATDPNPRHAGKACGILRKAGLTIRQGVLEKTCKDLNEAFNHWIVKRTPFVTVKAAMTLDGKIATATGESKWITSEAARSYAMKLRQGSDAILVGINTLLADDPSLTVRSIKSQQSKNESHTPRRIVLDARARTPLRAKVVSDKLSALTTIVVAEDAPRNRLDALAKRARVLLAPAVPAVATLQSRNFKDRDFPGRPRYSAIDLPWLLETLGNENVTSLLVEGGGEVNASFLLQDLAQRIAFFYAPKVLGGRNSVPAVGGNGVLGFEDALRLTQVQWRRLGPDLLLGALLDFRP